MTLLKMSLVLKKARMPITQRVSNLGEFTGNAGANSGGGKPAHANEERGWRNCVAAPLSQNSALSRTRDMLYKLTQVKKIFK
jgi:hypothetical protein